MENPDPSQEGLPEGSPEGGADGDQHQPDHTGQDTLNDLIERAKRAHELVDAVDLERVAAHDQTELSKLRTVSDALSKLERGELVAHVEGVDEVLGGADPDDLRKAELIQHIASQGAADRVARVLACNADAREMMPLELIPHRQGLPEFHVCVAPEAGVGNGYFGLFISDTGIFAATVSDPPNKHLWRIARSSPYDDMDELTQTLAQFSRNAFD